MVSWWWSGSEGRTEGSYPVLLGNKGGDHPRSPRRSGLWLPGRIPARASRQASIIFLGLIVLVSAVGIVPGGALAALDLSLTSSARGEAVFAGESFSYTFEVRNSGPAASVIITTNFSIPEGVTLESFTLSRGEYDRRGGVWTVGDLSAGGVERLTVDLVVAPSVPPGTVISAAAMGFKGRADPRDERTEATSVTTVMAEAEVRVVVTCPSPEEGGEDMPLYVVNVANHGPSYARNVWFMDLIPVVMWLNGARYRNEATGDEGDWIGFLDLGDLAPGETKRVRVYGDLSPTTARSNPGVTITVRWMDSVDPACNSEVSSCRVDRIG